MLIDLGDQLYFVDVFKSIPGLFGRKKFECALNHQEIIKVAQFGDQHIAFVFVFEQIKIQVIDLVFVTEQCI